MLNPLPFADSAVPRQGTGSASCRTARAASVGPVPEQSPNRVAGSISPQGQRPISLLPGVRVILTRRHYGASPLPQGHRLNALLAGFRVILTSQLYGASPRQGTGSTLF